MRVVIIEDELPSSRRLERMLQEFNYEVLTSLVSVKAAVKWFETNEHPDVLFLDIHLSDGLCFEIFKHVNIKSPIVFTTAFSEYSIKAFDYNSISYLLKPIKKEQLAQAVEKATMFSIREKELIALKKAVGIESLSFYKSQFVVRVGKKVKIIEAEKTTCFFSEDNTTYIRTNGINYVINSSLTQLKDELNPSLFFKVNRKIIISRATIKGIQIHKNRRFKLELNGFDDNEIIVSRDRAKAFKFWLDK